MKIYSKLLAFILCLTLVFSVSALFLGVSAETQIEEGTETDDEVNTETDSEEVTETEGEQDTEIDGMENDKKDESSDGEEKDNVKEEQKEEQKEDGKQEKKDENFFEAFASMFKRFEPKAFFTNLEYMGIGMLGIFFVIGIIVIATVVINKVFSGREKKEEN